MPKYFKKKSRTYGRRNKKPWYARRYSAVELAGKAWSGVKMLKGLVNVEKHYFDTTDSGSLSNAGSVTLLSGIAQGDDVNSRNGNSVLAKTLLMRYHYERAASNTALVNYVRMMIIKDLENTGSAPTVTDVLASADVNSPLNVDHTSRYQVIRDKLYAFSTNGTEGKIGKEFIKINDHLKFTGSAGSNVYKNALYCLLITDQSANPPGYAWQARLGYYDN